MRRKILKKFIKESIDHQSILKIAKKQATNPDQTVKIETLHQNIAHLTSCLKELETRSIRVVNKFNKHSIENYDSILLPLCKSIESLNLSLEETQNQIKSQVGDFKSEDVSYLKNSLLENYIKNQVIYYNEIDHLFESILNKNKRIDENILKNIKNFVSNTTPLEKILILAIGATGVLGTQILKNIESNPNIERVVNSISDKIVNHNIPDGVEFKFKERIKKNDFSQLTFEEISAIKSVFGIEDNNVNQENQENPLVLLFQELLSNSLNLSEDVLEDLSLNKESIEADLGINKFNSFEEWSQNVLTGENDDIISFFRQPMKLEQSEDENDLFAREGINEINPAQREAFKKSVQEKINFLKTQNASPKIKKLFLALGALKICGALDDSDINQEYIDRASQEVGEEAKEVLGKYVTNTAYAFTEFDNLEYK